MRDRIKAMFLGVMIGDSLGMPVETWSQEKIQNKYGRITDYFTPSGHKWFDGEEAGTYTDDTYLTIAVAKAMIENPLDMTTQAKYHVEALKDTPKGWGRSTKNSVERIISGTHWSQSAEPPTEGGRGTGGGNGVPMKIAPIGAYMWKGMTGLKTNTEESMNQVQDTIKFAVRLSQMTHGTMISHISALVQMTAISQCLLSPKGNLDLFGFKQTVLGAAVMTPCEDPIAERLKNLYNNIDTYTTEKIIEDFGGGSCYCYNSVPFTHAFFLKNPSSIESLYDVVNGGGDCDSNGSMLASMLGALNGMEIFPQHLISGLKQPELMLNLADEFCDRFEID